MSSKHANTLALSTVYFRDGSKVTSGVARVTLPSVLAKRLPSVLGVLHCTAPHITSPRQILTTLTFAPSPPVDPHYALYSATV